MAKQPKAKQNLRFKLKKQQWVGLWVPGLIALAIKIIWLNKVEYNGILGSDGESYLRGMESIWNTGIFSSNEFLLSFPAGYPIILAYLNFFSKFLTLPVTAVLQSALYLLSCVFFIKQIKRTRLAKFSLVLSIVLAFNPTLSLSSISIGYESPSASLFLISIAFLIRFTLGETSNSRIKIVMNLIYSSIAIGIASFMQPRLMPCGLAMLIIWLYHTQQKAIFVYLTITTICIVSIFPTILALRNFEANGLFTVSTNLGTTMSIGAGDKATGGYSNNSSGVPCNDTSRNSAEADTKRIKCVLAWYIDNSSKLPGLVIRKSEFYWSPWFGILANGTTARSPWLDVHPLNKYKKTESGIKLIYGNVGLFISWSWLLGSLFFLFKGFIFLWRANFLERLIGIAALSPTMFSWLISIGTIGDHRFRIPLMGLSLFLQIVGIFSPFGGNARLVGAPTSVYWKSLERKANLLP